MGKKLRELKRLFQLAVERKPLDENPFRNVKVPKAPRQKTKIYTAAEIDRMLRAASELQNESVLEWDSLITPALTTGMRRSELLNLACSDIDFGEMIVEVSPKQNNSETWEWRIKDTDRRFLPLKEDVAQLLIDLQNRRLEGYPYVFVPPGRYDHIQHDQGLSEYDVMTLPGYSDFATTHRFYLAVADDLVARARQAITHQVNPRLSEKCCKRNLKDMARESKSGANWCSE